MIFILGGILAVLAVIAVTGVNAHRIQRMHTFREGRYDCARFIHSRIANGMSTVSDARLVYPKIWVRNIFRKPNWVVTGTVFDRNDIAKPVVMEVYTEKVFKEVVHECVKLIAWSDKIESELQAQIDAINTKAYNPIAIPVVIQLDDSLWLRLDCYNRKPRRNPTP